MQKFLKCLKKKLPKEFLQKTSVFYFLRNSSRMFSNDYCLSVISPWILSENFTGVQKLHDSRNSSSILFYKESSKDCTPRLSRPSSLLSPTFVEPSNRACKQQGSWESKVGKPCFRNYSNVSLLISLENCPGIPFKFFHVSFQKFFHEFYMKSFIDFF